MVQVWRDGYDWRIHKAQLNEELPQFTVSIDVEGHGVLNIHYVHKESLAPNAIPLLFVHGWPGGFFEVRKLLPYLLDASGDHPSFTVVAISLPGFGFSEAPKRPGFGIEQMAETCHKLMQTLNYTQHVAQGGDWGAAVCRCISQRYGPKYCKAWHTNLPLAFTPHPIHRPLLFLKNLLHTPTPNEQRSQANTQEYFTIGNGYYKQQATMPQTLGYSLADSPAGLLGWIYEKLYTWTDKYEWSDSEVLTWVSLYWFSRAGPAASVRIYYEFSKRHGESGFLKNLETSTPTGYSYFPREIIGFPRFWYRHGFPNVIFESEHDKAGHLAAYEVPEALAGDLRKMFGKGGPTFGAVEGKTGYL